MCNFNGLLSGTFCTTVTRTPLGIRINAVCPGTIVTPMAEKMMSDPAVSDWVDGMRKRHIVGRFGMPSDVAKTAAWLLSDLSSFTTGTPVLVDGGFSLC
jgi:NAD(P)-dependent dehydrogenase (short-subunit alcohol dehydrogenase family)